MLIELALNFLIFTLAVISSFTIPGVFLLKFTKLKLSVPEQISLGTVIGFTFLTLLAYILLQANLIFLILPIIAAFNISYFKNISFGKTKFNFSINLPTMTFLLVLVIGVFGQMLVIAPSGTYSDQGLVFYSSHGHDGPWHIALMEEIKQGFPLQNPALSSEKLVNYHFFSDIAPAIFSLYFRLPNLDLYFRFFPLMFSILLGVLTFFIGKEIGKSFFSGIWSMVFTYFAGSFGYIVTLKNNQGIGGESIFWATQIQSSIGNPPQIAAFIIILAFLYLFLFWLSQQKNKSLLLICAILIAPLIVFKVYASIVLLASLLLVSAWQIIRERKFYILILTLIGGLSALLLYLPNAKQTTSFLIWEPWWYIRTMVVAGSRLDWLDMELKRQTYIADQNWKRVLQLEITAFLIFFFGNLGMRFIGFLSFGRFFKSLPNNYFFLLLTLISLFSFVLPLLFLQKGVASNTIQFMQYFLLLFGVLAGVSVSFILNKIKIQSVKIIFISAILILSIPTQIGLLNDFYSRPPLAKIEKEELEALTYLKKNAKENSVVLTPPYNKYLNLKLATPPIWAWFDTSYIPAFSGRRTYLSDTEQVDIMGYNFRDRQTLQNEVFEKISDPYLKLKAANIQYLYFPTIVKPKFQLGQNKYRLFYSNDRIQIWEII